MYNRRTPRDPDPLSALMLDFDPVADLMAVSDVVTGLRGILDRAQSLAAVCVAASQSPMLDEHDLTQALEVLQGYLLATALAVTRWQDASFPDRTGPRPDAEVPDA
jgi:hypothetical protein